jgi:hypothetical protein
MADEWTDAEATELEAGDKLTAIVASVHGKTGDWESEALLTHLDDFDTKRPDAAPFTRLQAAREQGQALRKEALSELETVDALYSAHLERLEALMDVRRELPNEVERLVQNQPVTPASPVRGLSTSDLLAARHLELLGLERAERIVSRLTVSEAMRRYETALSRQDVNAGDLFFMRTVEEQARTNFRGLVDGDTPGALAAVLALQATVKRARDARVPAMLREKRALAEKGARQIRLRRDVLRALPAFGQDDVERIEQERRMRAKRAS